MSLQFDHLPAPAKLNLFLHVTGRRPDGYHLLESVFFMIDLADDVGLRPRTDGKIEREGDIIGDVDKDLCVRAARLLQAHTGCTSGVDINVTKRIPAGAGMGGGSSDAATTLIGLNRLWSLGLSRAELMRLGESLGADVPFFIYGQTSFVQGIGEIHTPIDIPVSAWSVVMPKEPTPTGKIFSSEHLTRNTKSLKIANLSALLASEWPELPGRNDLQPVVVMQNQGVQDALDFLGAGARMTGSGSAVFAHAATLEEARKKLQMLPDDASGFAVSTLDRHPLYHWVER